MYDRHLRIARLLCAACLLALGACGDDDPDAGSAFSSDADAVGSEGAEASAPRTSAGEATDGSSGTAPATRPGQSADVGGTEQGTSTPPQGTSGSAAPPATQGQPASSAPAATAPSGGQETSAPPSAPPTTPDPDPSSTPVEPLPTPSGADPVPTLAEVHAQVFQTRCTGCHGTRGGLSLANNAGLRDRLLASSTQLPSMPRVTPGDATRSYLWHKMANTHTDVGGTGAVMPTSGSLSAELLDIVLDWIEGGAP